MPRITTEQEALAYIATLNASGAAVAIDIETTGLDPWKDELISVAITGEDSLQSVVILPASLAHVLTKLETGPVLHNFKFDYQFLYRKGIDLTQHEPRDTMLMHHLLDENAPHSLDSIIKERFRDSYKEAFWAAHPTFADATEEEQDAYAAKDVYYTRKIYFEFTTELAASGIPDELVHTVHNFALRLLETELRGIKLDLNRLARVGVQTLVKIDSLHSDILAFLPEEIKEIEEELYQKERAKRKTEKGKNAVKRPSFSLNSTEQLQTLLYKKLRLPTQFSPTRKPTVDDNALSKLEDAHPAVAKIREYRGEQKVHSAFLEAALEKSRKGRIYPSFNINGTVTGRISASNPNLQQLPSSGGIRGMYIPDEGMSFISCDYKQLEVTLAAHFSRDPNLLRVVNEGVSLHDITAEGLGIERSLAKTVNFAIQYGAGTKKIQKILKCSEKDAEHALAKYWATYPGLKKLIDRCHACVDQGKAIVNPFGRQRRLFVDDPNDKWAVMGVKRQAFNSLIQGTGADITNTAFLDIANELAYNKHGIALFVVHDEILVAVLDKYVIEYNYKLPNAMAAIAERIGLTVPLAAESSGGMKRWLD